MILGMGFCSEWADLFAEDALLEWPLAPADLPRQMHGRDEVRRRLSPVQAKAMASIKSRSNSTATVYEATDPEVLVAQLSGDIELHTGERFHHTLLHVVRVRNGEIVHFQDYFNPDAAAPGYSEVLQPLRTAGGV
jgi:ketosteroid isomerase-like protein